MQQKIEETVMKIQPILVCSANIPASYFCAQQNCTQRAMLCNDEKCQCQRLHQKSCGMKAKYKAILDPIYTAKNSPELSKAIKMVEKIFQDLLELVSNQRQKSIQKVENLVLRSGENELFKRIQASNYDEITGDLIYKVYSSRKTQEISFQNRINDKSLQFCSNKSVKIVKQCGSVLQKQISLLANSSFNALQLDSKIIKAQQQISICSFFDKSIVEMKLLFRASQHDFKSPSFHTHCDGKQNTIVVIVTEKGKKVGGFNPMKWSSNGGSMKDVNNKCFLFSLDEKQKYPCNDPENAVLYYSSNGPTFGKAQSDIYIPNQANKSSCNFNIGNSYGKKEFQGVQNRFKRFAGIEAGYQAKIKEYEVFQLTFFQEQYQN